MQFLKKNWFVVLIGCLSSFLGVLTLLTIVKLKKTTPIAPTAPEKKPQAAIPACTLTFKLSPDLSSTPSSSLNETLFFTPTPTEKLLALDSEETNQPPICNELIADITSGKAPLLVNFTGSGFDPDGKITAFEIPLGDGEVEMVEKDVEGTASHSLDYTYSSTGVYWASLSVRDDNNVWSETSESCKVRIEIEENLTPAPTEKAVGGQGLTPTPKEIAQAPTITQTPSPTPTKRPTPTSTPIPVPKLPEAGIALPSILTVLSGSLLILLGILL